MSAPTHPAGAPSPMTGPAADHPLEPPLPYRMAPRLARAARDVQLQQFVAAATQLKDTRRAASFGATFGDRLGAVRDLGASIKQHTLDHLDHYLDRFIDAAERAGATVHYAADAAEARDICLRIARDTGSRLCVKSKSMVTEEIRLLRALEAAGVRTVETDLGEFILQLDGDAPSHIVTPMIHKDRTAVARAFVRELGAPYTEDPGALTAIAREHLRALYRRADLGISGANFLVASTGSVVICTNEGNADFCVSGPRTHIAVAGIEKLIPGPEHLAVLLKLLARSSTAQPLTVYTTLITGPRRAPDPDGPDHVHIVLLDNGRTDLLRSPEAREMLRCIRCGACLNACPVFRKAGGGHAYGAVYSGPIGAILTPSLKGLHNYPDLPQASSLCGACADACPVRIDIPGHLVRLRSEMVGLNLPSGGRAQRAAIALWTFLLKRPRLYRLAAAAQRTILRALAERDAAPADDAMTDRRWLSSLPGPGAGWTQHRDFPTPPAAGFRSWWARHEREEKGGDTP